MIVTMRGELERTVGDERRGRADRRGASNRQAAARVVARDNVYGRLVDEDDEVSMPGDAAQQQNTVPVNNGGANGANSQPGPSGRPVQTSGPATRSQTRRTGEHPPDIYPLRGNT